MQPSYQAAYKCLGLLGDDKQWVEVLANAMNTTSLTELRQLFVIIILFCNVENAQLLFDTH